MTEAEYRRRIANERAKGRLEVAKIARRARRELFGAWPDPIDRENFARLHRAFANLGAVMERTKATLEPLRIHMEKTKDRDTLRFVAEQRMMLSVSPPPKLVGLVTT